MMEFCSGLLHPAYILNRSLVQCFHPVYATHLLSTWELTWLLGLLPQYHFACVQVKLQCYLIVEAARYLLILTRRQSFKAYKEKKACT